MIKDIKPLLKKTLLLLTLSSQDSQAKNKPPVQNKPKQTENPAPGNNVPPSNNKKEANSITFQEITVQLNGTKVPLNEALNNLQKIVSSRKVPLSNELNILISPNDSIADLVLLVTIEVLKSLRANKHEINTNKNTGMMLVFLVINGFLIKNTLSNEGLSKEDLEVYDNILKDIHTLQVQQKENNQQLEEKILKNITSLLKTFVKKLKFFNESNQQLNEINKFLSNDEIINMMVRYIVTYLLKVEVLKTMQGFLAIPDDTLLNILDQTKNKNNNETEE